MSKQSSRVSIIILNWNGKANTIECLESLKKIDYPNYDIILVDNGSSDGSPEYFTEHYPYVKLIRNKINLGFTGGTNIGVRHALKQNANYIFILNNDTIVKPNFLTELVNVAEENDKIGIVGSKFYYYTPSDIIWSAGGTYMSFLGKARSRGINKKDNPKYNKKIEIPWVTGCALIRRVVFEKIGYLEDKYFISYEDVDFCFKARKAGFLIYYVPTSVIYHKVARDSGGINNPLYIYYQVRNNLLFIKRNVPFPNNMVAYALFFTVSILRRIVNILLYDEPAKIKALFFGIGDFLNGAFGEGVLSKKIKIELSSQKRNYRVGINARYLQREMTGIEKYTHEIIENVALNDKNTEYYLFFLSGLSIPQMNLPENVKIIKSSFSGNLRMMRLFWELIYLYFEIKKYNLDVFHGPAFFVPLIKPRKCKYITTVHDLAFLRYPDAFTNATKMYYHLFFKRSLQLCDKIICVSNSTKKDIEEYYHTPEKKEIVIFSGVSSIYKNEDNEKKREQIMRKYGINKDYFLFVGALSPRKNIIKILNAFKDYSYELKKEQKEKSDFSLVIVGKKAWLYDSIFLFIKQYHLEKDVLFLDYVPEDDIVVLYSNAELFLFPSLYEGFGFPVLEAMACGIPVITSNVSSMPEIAGDAAILVNPESTEEIKEAMIRIMNNPKLREELIKKGKRQIKKFTWKESAEKTIQVYHELGKQN